MEKQTRAAPVKKKYFINGIFFEVPAAAIVYGETDTQRSHPTFMIRYLVEPEGYRISVSLRPDISSTEEAAVNAYQGANESYSDENMPPVKINENIGSGWRCRKRFEDGFQTPYTIETVFLKTSIGAIEIRFIADPNVFFQFLPSFDLFLSSLKAT